MKTSLSASNESLTLLPQLMQVLMESESSISSELDSSSTQPSEQTFNDSQKITDSFIPRLKQMIDMYKEMVSVLEHHKSLVEGKNMIGEKNSNAVTTKMKTQGRRESKPIRYLESVIDSVLYIASSYNYCHIYYKDGRQTTQSDYLRISLKKVHQHFGDRFVKVHSSYLVNPDYIVGFKKRDSKKDFDLIISDEKNSNTIIPVSRRHTKELIEKAWIIQKGRLIEQ